MTRQLRLEFPGSFWHVTSRGNERHDIFRDDFDRRFFLETLGEAVERFDWILPAYVLMSNHVHLALRLTAATLSKGMRWLNSTYARAFNRRHHRVGHLFQGRFHGVIIDEQTYYLEVLRYIVLNPVRARIVQKPEQFRWSSHLAAIGAVTPPGWLAVEDVLAHFANTRELAQKRYRTFIHDAIGSERRPWDDLIGQIYLGRKEWMDKIKEEIAVRPRSDDHPRMQREFRQLAMTDVVSAVAQTWSVDAARIRRGRGGVARLAAAWVASREAFLTNREIAAGLRLQSAGRVTQMLQECDRLLDRSPALRAAVDRSISTLRRKN